MELRTERGFTEEYFLKENIGLAIKSIDKEFCFVFHVSSCINFTTISSTM